MSDTQHNRIHAWILIVLCFVVGLGSVVFKVSKGYPLWPGEGQSLWTLDVAVDFVPTEDQSKLFVNLPKVAKGFSVLDVTPTSSTMSVMIINKYQYQFSGDNLSGQQSINLKVCGFQSTSGRLLDTIEPKAQEWDELGNAAEQAAIRSYLDGLDGDKDSMDRLDALLEGLFHLPKASLISKLIDEHGFERVAVQIVFMDDWPVTMVSGNYLKEQTRSRHEDIFGVQVDDEWHWFDLDASGLQVDDSFLPWKLGDSYRVDLVGGESASTYVTPRERWVNDSHLATLNDDQDDGWMNRLSIYRLPNAQQNAIAMTLLVPLGVLIVAIARILIGMPTSGTFMPVLIALALMETTWLSGIVMFVTIVGCGLFLRSLMDWLDLLLVARISVVVALVILLVVLIDLLVYASAPTADVDASYFPIIIIAWTIERMSVLWEEEGSREVAKQSVGALTIASVCYAVMINDLVQHVMYTFPLMILVVVACLIMLGRYTGYRLWELYRFRDIKGLKSS